MFRKNRNKQKGRLRAAFVAMKRRPYAYQESPSSPAGDVISKCSNNRRGSSSLIFLPQRLMNPSSRSIRNAALTLGWVEPIIAAMRSCESVCGREQGDAATECS